MVAPNSYIRRVKDSAVHRDAGECQLEEIWRTCRRNELAEGQVVDPEVLGPGQEIWIGLDATDYLAEDDPEREDVRGLVVELAPQALGRHPVGRTHLQGDPIVIEIHKMGQLSTMY